ncbi:putative long-chain-fatty-acid--CoA ligase [Rosa chinensis]|uniref:Putative long-chain-fatty-acid--CoA ligase n=1 Tax=Rosa chinensis TaxID=74649 RepID=A0A2P6PNU1_ROSCH|nr:putative long-chain-fatty-acid--CoA ligase [Rosa chinensis]
MSCLGCNLVINFHQVLYLCLVYCTFWKHKCTSFICPRQINLQRTCFGHGKPNTKAIFDVRFLLDDIQELKPTMFCLRGFELLKAVHLEPNPFDIERDLMTPNFQTEKTASTQILQGMISTWIRKGWNFDELILNMYVELYHLQERVDKLYNEAKGGKV